MKVKIIKCSEPTYWYADKIGQEFEVDSYEDFREKYNGSKPPIDIKRNYFILDNNCLSAWRAIGIEDCEETK